MSQLLATSESEGAPLHGQKTGERFAKGSVLVLSRSVMDTRSHTLSPCLKAIVIFEVKHGCFCSVGIMDLVIGRTSSPHVERSDPNRNPCGIGKVKIRAGRRTQEEGGNQ